MHRPDIEGFAANVLHEVRVASAHFVDQPNGLRRELHGSVRVLDGLENGVSAVGLAQPVERQHAKHPLRERAGFDEFGEERRQSGERQHKADAFALDGLEHVQQQRDGVFVAGGVVGEVCASS